MAHSYSNILVHIIFSTKGRKPWFNDDLKERLYNYMGGILQEIKCQSLIINGPADHVHLLVNISTQTSIADLARVFKTNSSRWVHQTYPRLREFYWQTGYAAFSAIESNRDCVIAYIESQVEHHK